LVLQDLVARVVLAVMVQTEQLGLLVMVQTVELVVQQLPVVPEV
jgi:hypothetical protein